MSDTFADSVFKQNLSVTQDDSEGIIAFIVIFVTPFLAVLVALPLIAVHILLLPITSLPLSFWIIKYGNCDTKFDKGFLEGMADLVFWLILPFFCL